MRLRTEEKVYDIVIEHNGETGQFQVSPLNPESASKLLKKHTSRKKWNNGQAGEPEVDWVEMRIEKTQRVIKGWDATDEMGNALECSNENKRIAFLLNSEVINKVLAEADELGLGLREEEEKELKNL